jgi:flagellar basal body-associated protein FliL
VVLAALFAFVGALLVIAAWVYAPNPIGNRNGIIGLVIGLLLFITAFWILGRWQVQKQREEEREKKRAVSASAAAAPPSKRSPVASPAPSPSSPNNDNNKGDAIWAVGAIIGVIGSIAAVGTIVYTLYAASIVDVNCYWVLDSLICNDSDERERQETIQNWVVISIVLVTLAFIIKGIGNRHSKKKEKKERRKEGGAGRGRMDGWKRDPSTTQQPGLDWDDKNNRTTSSSPLLFLHSSFCPMGSCM